MKRKIRQYFQPQVGIVRVAGPDFLGAMTPLIYNRVYVEEFPQIPPI
jgi:hypothetical protein